MFEPGELAAEAAKKRAGQPCGLAGRAGFFTSVDGAGANRRQTGVARAMRSVPSRWANPEITADAACDGGNQGPREEQSRLLPRLFMAQKTP
jgi:hypothetical protein